MFGSRTRPGMRGGLGSLSGSSLGDADLAALDQGAGTMTATKAPAARNEYAGPAAFVGGGILLMALGTFAAIALTERSERRRYRRSR